MSDTRRRIEGSLALEQKEPRVIVIEAREQTEAHRLRVAAYARVSSDSDDQLNSFAAQTRYFTDLIAGNDKWELADIYADEAVSGTSAEKREDFQRLLLDCRRGRVDRVITKSVSRFARNTKDCLEAIRELKRIGVSVYFEEQRIDTADMSGEMLTAIFAGIAQAESESISKNMRWSYQKRMQSGEFLPSSMPYGYIIQNGRIEINEMQAEVVRRIFADYLIGKNMDEICDMLNRENVPVKLESRGHIWHRSALAYILSNERYIGDSLWQKTYATDTLPAVQVRNKGAREQYYAESTHAPIISKATFNAVQELRKRRNESAGAAMRREPSIFNGIIRCGNCGKLFRRKTANGKTSWICKTHAENAANCTVSGFSETDIHNAFLRLFYKLKHSGAAMLSELYSDLTDIGDRQMLWNTDVIELNKRICDILEQDRQLNELNSLGLAEPDFYILRGNELAAQLRAAKLEKTRFLSAAGDDTLHRTQELIEALDAAPEILYEFDGEWFTELVDAVIVESSERLRFRLKNGLELPESIERTVR